MQPMTIVDIGQISANTKKCLVAQKKLKEMELSLSLQHVNPNVQRQLMWQAGDDFRILATPASCVCIIAHGNFC